jgi:hypothetical protein
MEAARKQQEIVGFWPIADMAQEMRVEHDRLTQLGWVYDGFGGYRKKAPSPPVQNLRRLTCKSMAGSGPPTAKLFVSAGGFDAPRGAV